ncbi:MAG: polymer-forming cytoskeletal protein [Candidatus Omnitrophica bacterium]|nr:polymer-forming cytoskeletal protein [Candidatus Omnitrophota bacterium]
MRKREQVKVETRQEEKILDVSAAMKGTLRFDDPVNLRINGKFEGTLDAKGNLVIGDKAQINANITGESISIEGKVTGNIKASRILRLGEAARLDGDVETPALSVQEGAILVGQVRMENGSAGRRPFDRDNIMDTRQVAKYLEVDKEKINEWTNSGVLPGSRENGEWLFEKKIIDDWVAKGRIKA